MQSPSPLSRDGVEDVTWLLGRGISFDCGLIWNEPKEWGSLPRECRIAKVKDALAREMVSPQVDTSVLRKFLRILDARHNARGYRHHFVTSNWDTLLDREMDALCRDRYDNACPEWTRDGILHLNGAVDDDGISPFRSHFVFPEDWRGSRRPSVESNIAADKVIGSSAIIIAGLSFACDADNALLDFLREAADETPIGEAHCLVIDPCHSNLQRVCSILRCVLPEAEIDSRQSTFGDWIRVGLVELTELEIIR